MDTHLLTSSVVKDEAAQQWAEFSNREVPEPPQIDREARKFNTVEEAEKALGKSVDPRLKYLFCQPRFEQRTPQWYTARNDAITASDFGAAAGHAEYGNPVQVYRRKIENIPQQFSEFSQRAMGHGVKYEDAAAFRYEQVTGNTLLDFGLLSHWKLWEMQPAGVSGEEWFDKIHGAEKPDVLTDSEWERVQDLRWIKGSPDGVTTNGILLEFKCPVSNFKDNVVKDMYRAQVEVNMQVMGLDLCHFVQYAPQTSWLFGERFNLIEIRRDDGWYEIIRGKARKVWDWITFTRRTGQIHPAVADRLRIAQSSSPDAIRVESTRRSSSVKDAPQKPKKEPAQPPPIQMIPFPEDERNWEVVEPQPAPRVASFAVKLSDDETEDVIQEPKRGKINEFSVKKIPQPPVPIMEIDEAIYASAAAVDTTKPQ